MKRRFESRLNAVLWAVVAATAVLLAWRGHAATTDVVILQRDSSTSFTSRTITGSSHTSQPLLFNGSGVLTAGQLDLTAGVTGTLPVANGGTGLTALGTGVATWLGTPSLANLNTALGSTVLVSGGAAGTPSSINLTNGTALPLSTGVTGTLPVANGGTGQTTASNGQLLIGNGSGFSKATLTAGSGVSITNGSGTITIAATGGGGSLPDQTGHAGHYLTTNGTAESWAAIDSDVIDAINAATIWPEIVFASDSIQSPLFLVQNGSETVSIVADVTTSPTLTIKDGSGDIATRQWVSAQSYASQGAYTTSGLTMSTARLLGRTSASAGAAEEISIGSGLSLNAGQLSATGGGLGGGTGSVDNAVTRADGTGAATLQGSDISISDSTTSTANQVGFVNIHSGQTNSSLYLAPKGTGAFWLGPAATGSSTTGNARGANAFDAQTLRNAATQVASGGDSFLGGSYSTASGTHAIAIGYGNSSSGFASVAVGGGNIASGDYSLVAGGISSATATGSTAVGMQSSATHVGEFAVAGGRRSIAGDAQTSMVTAFGTTTNNTVTEIYLNGVNSSLTIPSGHCYACDIRWVAKSGANVAGGKRFCIINNNAGTTALDGAVDTIGTDHNTPGWGGITITAVDSTTDYLKIEVTGATSTTINWVVTINFTVNG